MGRQVKQTKTALGRRLARLRSARNMTQRELCRRAGVSEGTYACVESGRSTDPGAFLMCRIARALRVTVEQILRGVEG